MTGSGRATYIDHLHSNMERFKDTDLIHLRRFFYNLHSNMERFKAHRNALHCMPTDQFTFQYGEI